MSAGSSLPLSMSLSSQLRELAYVRRHAFVGRTPVSVFAHLSKPAGPSSSIKISGSGANGGGGGAGESSKVGDFLYYSDSDDEDFDLAGAGYQPGGDRLSCNFVDCLAARETGLHQLGGGRYFNQRLSSEYGTRHMLANAMMKETSVLMPNMDKIFCSKWLSHRQVVFGTKCNKVSSHYEEVWLGCFAAPAFLSDF